jgi:hypothetical protein
MTIVVDSCKLINIFEVQEMGVEEGGGSEREGKEMDGCPLTFTSWDEFREEFTAAFCPENEATTALMWLESDCYFQGK